MYVSNGKYIGKNHPCFVIAEVGQNHQGNFDIAKEMIIEAKKAGADCVKFQKTCLQEKFTKAALGRKYESPNSWGMTYGEHKMFLEFSEDDFKQLKMFAEQNDIIFSSSAMDVDSGEFLCKLNLPFIKIGSGDSNNIPLIEDFASKNIPLIISTGMLSSLSEVAKIYDTVIKYHDKLCLMHCVSAYPTPYEDCNLNLIRRYKEEFENIPIGYSGHELGISVSLAAVALGAKVIERHFTLNKNWKGTDHSSSLMPDEFKTMVDEIRIIERALGNPNKKLVDSEEACRAKLQKSLTTSKVCKKDDIIHKENIKIKVSEPRGINAIYYDSVVGKTINCDKNDDEPFFLTDFQDLDII